MATVDGSIGTGIAICKSPKYLAVGSISRVMTYRNPAVRNGSIKIYWKLSWAIFVFIFEPTQITSAKGIEKRLTTFFPETIVFMDFKNVTKLDVEND